ncbi:hypothetical protein [Rhizobium lentis]|uniref:hypothetical protein n=1 Tax=Rhizobium lentis TaxID=1138194 RepID=UPI001C83DB76|nr:hypothetical protein [Rhizobium lentis]MBX4986702.1 hypothetical protein [Rhizobium lentis]MBX5005146.1 hypothetical protein [Rhizobium lentis]MBX5029750.1 hypothetical protein [Rhizobium lentis]
MRDLQTYSTGCGMETDHQPNKPSRKTITIAAILTAVVALVSWYPLQKSLLRRVIDQFPTDLTMFLTGVLTAGWLCFFIARRDALHALRPSDLSIGWSRNDFPAVLKYAAHILVRAPFAVFLLPIRGWKQARAKGEGTIFSFINCLLGGVLGFMVTLATLLLVAIPIQIAFEGG